VGEESLHLYEALVKSGLATSNRMAREFIENGAVSVNGEKIINSATGLNWEMARYNKYVLLKRGKKLFNLFYKP
jgi:tyrosyl-tRNA synthetase